MAGVIAFIQAHSVAMSAVGVAILDFAIDVMPSLKSNSIIGLILGFLSPKPPAV